MKTALLSDLLTPEQITDVQSIMSSNNPDLVGRLKSYLNQHRARLESKGVVPDYLAYVLYVKTEGIT